MAQSLPTFHTLKSLFIYTDSLHIATKAHANSRRFFVNRQDLVLNAQIDCSSETTPCPEGCQEIADCNDGAPCAIRTNLFQYTLSQALTQGCSCRCKVADSSEVNDVVVEDALLSLYNSTSGADWYISTNWHNASLSYCSRWGVYCDAANNIIGVGMVNNNMMGPLPSPLFSIPKVQSSLGDIFFSYNYMTGTIPSLIGRLKRVYSLTVTSNNLEGEWCIATCNRPVIQ